MAKEDAKPSAAEKGKGKAVDEKLPNGDGKVDALKIGPDGKPTDGKKHDEPQEGIITPILFATTCLYLLSQRS